MRTANCIFLIFLSFICFYTCQKDTSPINMKPIWLNEFVEDIKDDQAYHGAVITRYEWKNKYYYHVFIPISSCYMCEVYNQNGELMIWNDSTAIDFSNNRKNGFVIWRWIDNKQLI